MVVADDLSCGNMIPASLEAIVGFVKFELGLWTRNHGNSSVRLQLLADMATYWYGHVPITWPVALTSLTLLLKQQQNHVFTCENSQILKNCKQVLLRPHRDCNNTASTHTKWGSVNRHFNILGTGNHTYKPNEPRQANLCLRAFRHDKL